MKFLADECCDADMIASLRADGHDVLYIMEFKTINPYSKLETGGFFCSYRLQEISFSISIPKGLRPKSEEKNLSPFLKK